MLAVGVRQGLSPVLDVARDPRWGRIEETFGEDPYLIARMGVAYVKGLQGRDIRDGVIATVKHFAGYGKSEAGLNHAPSGRFFANAAWLGCAVLAHNLTRWSARLGHIHADDQLTVVRTVRSRVFRLPGVAGHVAPRARGPHGQERRHAGRVPAPPSGILAALL